MSLPRRLEMGEERLRAVNHTPEVDVHQPLEVVVGHRGHVGAEGHAGVVDDDVHPTVVGDDLVGPGVHVVASGHVEATGGHLHAPALTAGRRLGQAGLVDVADRQVGTPTAQLDREGPADPRARSRDGGHPAPEPLHEVSSRASSTIGAERMAR